MGNVHFVQEWEMFILCESHHHHDKNPLPKIRQSRCCSILPSLPEPWHYISFDAPLILNIKPLSPDTTAILLFQLRCTNNRGWWCLLLVDRYTIIYARTIANSFHTDQIIYHGTWMVSPWPIDHNNRPPAGQTSADDFIVNNWHNEIG